MGKNFFPSKQYNTGHPPEEWEKKMRVSLMDSLTKAIYTIKESSSSRIVQKSVYIEHLIKAEKIKRLKHVIPQEEEDDPGIPMPDVPGENEE